MIKLKLYNLVDLLSIAGDEVKHYLPLCPFYHHISDTLFDIQLQQIYDTRSMTKPMYAKQYKVVRKLKHVINTDKKSRKQAAIRFHRKLVCKKCSGGGQLPVSVFHNLFTSCFLNEYIYEVCF